jgi:hypothetical protein
VTDDERPATAMSAALPYSSIDPEVLAEMAARFKATPLHALLGLDIRPFDPADPELAVVDMPVAPDAFGSTGNLHAAPSPPSSTWPAPRPRAGRRRSSPAGTPS